MAVFCHDFSGGNMTNEQQTTTWLALILCGMTVLPVFGGYRNVDHEMSASQKREQNNIAAAPKTPPGGWSKVTISRTKTDSSQGQGTEKKAEVQTLRNGRRTGQLVQVRPREQIEMRLQKDVRPGATAIAYTVNGGHVNGKTMTTLKADDDGVFQFSFKAGPYPGDYPVVFRYAGREEVLEFWINGAKASSEEGK